MSDDEFGKLDKTVQDAVEKKMDGGGDKGGGKSPAPPSSGDGTFDFSKSSDLAASLDDAFGKLYDLADVKGEDQPGDFKLPNGYTLKNEDDFVPHASDDPMFDRLEGSPLWVLRDKDGKAVWGIDQSDADTITGMPNAGGSKNSLGAKVAKIVEGNQSSGTGGGGTPQVDFSKPAPDLPEHERQLNNVNEELDQLESDLRDGGSHDNADRVGEAIQHVNDGDFDLAQDVMNRLASDVGRGSGEGDAIENAKRSLDDYVHGSSGPIKKTELEDTWDQLAQDLEDGGDDESAGMARDIYQRIVDGDAEQALALDVPDLADMHSDGGPGAGRAVQDAIKDLNNFVYGGSVDKPSPPFDPRTADPKSMSDAQLTASLDKATQDLSQLKPGSSEFSAAFKRQLEVSSEFEARQEPDPVLSDKIRKTGAQRFDFSREMEAAGGPSRLDWQNMPDKKLDEIIDLPPTSADLLKAHDLAVAQKGIRQHLKDNPLPSPDSSEADSGISIGKLKASEPATPSKSKSARSKAKPGKLAVDKNGDLIDSSGDKFGRIQKNIGPGYSLIVDGKPVRPPGGWSASWKKGEAHAHATKLAAKKAKTAEISGGQADLEKDEYQRLIRTLRPRAAAGDRNALLKKASNADIQKAYNYVYHSYVSAPPIPSELGPLETQMKRVEIEARRRGLKLTMPDVQLRPDQ
jgi:hypothetical protein